MLGFGLILEALFLIPSLNDFFSAAGPLLGQEYWSLLNLGGVWWVKFWLLILGAMGVLLLFDFYPRAVSLIAFVGVNAFIKKAPSIFFGADWLLQILCLWSVFLPAGSTENEKTFSNGLSASVLVQTALVYFISGFAKAKNLWWEEPLATYYALGNHFYGGALGRSLQSWPHLLEWGTRAVWLWERTGWILFFVPWKNGSLRLAAIAAFAGLQLMFHFCMNLQLFPYMNLTLLALALPSLFWDFLGSPRFLQSRIISEPRQSLRRLWSSIAEPVAMVYLALMIWICLRFIPGASVNMPRFLERAVTQAALEQDWSLFAPSPPLLDGWFVFLGDLGEGKAIDLLTRKEFLKRLGYQGDPLSELPHFRWNNYLFLMQNSVDPIVVARLSHYLCEGFRGNQGERLKGVETYFIHHPVLPPGKERPLSIEFKHSALCGN